MKLHVLHRTRFKYATPVHESFNEARLQPVSTGPQACHSFVLKVLPAARLRHYLDFHLNCVHLFEVNQPHTELSVEANSVVTTGDLPVLAATATPAPLSRVLECARMERCYDFLQSSTYVEVNVDLWRLALDATEGQTDAWQAAQSIMRYIHREFRYQSSVTHAHTHMREVLASRAGVCQDFAHVMIGLCRALKIPALYVSGYLATEIASATHAWGEVLIPGTGWIALDPTHDRPVDQTYVKIAVGRDYADVPPVAGNYKGTTERKLEVKVDIKRLE